MNKILIPFAALIFYGGWAVYSNWMGGSNEETLIAWRAGFIQGSYAALLTFVTLILLVSIYRRIAPFFSATIAKLNTVALTTGLQYAVIVPVHWLNQTPNILLSLLPGLVIGSLFSFAYIHRYSGDD